MRYYQYRHINNILEHPLADSYQVKVLKDFKWDDWTHPQKKVAQSHKRSDIRLRDYPYRSKPVEGPVK